MGTFSIAVSGREPSFCSKTSMHVIYNYYLMAAGPGKGIGKAIAIRFAEEGGRLVLAGRKADVLEEVCAVSTSRLHCRHAAPNCCVLPLDCSIEIQYEAHCPCLAVKDFETKFVAYGKKDS